MKAYSINFYVACDEKINLKVHSLLHMYMFLIITTAIYAAYPYYKHFTDLKCRVSTLVSITYLIEFSLSNCFNTYNQIIVLLCTEIFIHMEPTT